MKSQAVVVGGSASAEDPGAAPAKRGQKGMDDIVGEHKRGRRIREPFLVSNVQQHGPKWW
jgi:hypothetical protein